MELKELLKSLAREFEKIKIVFYIIQYYEKIVSYRRR
jgi:hypothetical protein